MVVWHDDSTAFAGCGIPRFGDYGNMVYWDDEIRFEINYLF